MTASVDRPLKTLVVVMPNRPMVVVAMSRGPSSNPPRPGFGVLSATGEWRR